MADDAVDVGDAAADAAHDVVVVVGDPRFVARGAAGRFDAAREAGGAEHGERVVDGLLGDGADPGSHAVNDLLDGEMAAFVAQHREDGDPLGRDPQARNLQRLGNANFWINHKNRLIPEKSVGNRRAREDSNLRPAD